MSCPVHPVVAEVYAHRRHQPGQGRVPGQGVEAVVGVDIHIGRPHTAGHQHPALSEMVTGSGSGIILGSLNFSELEDWVS